MLRANVSVSSEVVRVGDVVDNAGSLAQVPIYRAPDLGTTGSLPVAQVVNALRAQGVIGVDTRDIKLVAVTRLARTVDSKEIERAVAQAIEHRGGLGDAANISINFDRDVADLRLDASNTGAMLATSARYEPRNGRFDVTFQIANDNGNPTQLRFTGSAIETVAVAVLTRNVERTDILKSADVIVERRPRAEVGSDPAAREQALGMQMRRQMILPSILGRSAPGVDLSPPARRAISMVSRSAASGCINPMISDILRGAICEAISISTAILAGRTLLRRPSASCSRTS